MSDMQSIWEPQPRGCRAVPAAFAGSFRGVPSALWSATPFCQDSTTVNTVNTHLRSPSLLLSSYSHPSPPRPPPLSTPANICHFARPGLSHAPSRKSPCFLQPPSVPSPQLGRSRGCGSAQRHPGTLTWPIRIQIPTAGVIAEGVGTWPGLGQWGTSSSTARAEASRALVCVGGASRQPVPMQNAAWNGASREKCGSAEGREGKLEAYSVHVHSWLHPWTSQPGQPSSSFLAEIVCVGLSAPFQLRSWLASLLPSGWWNWGDVQRPPPPEDPMGHSLPPPPPWD